MKSIQCVSGRCLHGSLQRYNHFLSSESIPPARGLSCVLLYPVIPDPSRFPLLRTAHLARRLSSSNTPTSSYPLISTQDRQQLQFVVKHISIIHTHTFVLSNFFSGSIVCLSDCVDPSILINHRTHPPQSSHTFRNGRSWLKMHDE